MPTRTYYVVTEFVMESEPEEQEFPDDFDFDEEFYPDEWQNVDDSVVRVRVEDEDGNVVYSHTFDSNVAPPYDDD